MNKMTKKHFCMILIVIICAVAVFWAYSKKKAPSNPYSEQLEQVDAAGNEDAKSEAQDDDNQDIENAVKDENTVVWTVPGLGKINPQNVEYLNELLARDGHSFKLAVRTIDASQEAQTYNDTIADLLKNGDTDIVYTGMLVDDVQIALPLIEKGYLEKLDSYLKTKQGKKLVNSMTEKEWEAVSLNGSQYVIPAQDLDSHYYVAFNKKYISEKEVEKFSGDWNDLLGIAADIQAKSESFVPIVWTMDSEGALEKDGYQNVYGLEGNIKTGELKNRFELPEYYELLKFLHTAWEKGYLGGEYSYGVIEEEISDAIEKKDYAVLVGYSDSFLANDKDDLIVVPVKNCKCRMDLDGCTGIAANSTKKEKAFALLSLIYTNKEYANALAFGKEGRDFERKNGYVTYSGQDEGAVLVPEVYGFTNLLYHQKGDVFSRAVFKSKRQYYSSKYCQSSVFLGFHVYTEKWNETIVKLKEVSELEEKICMASDFDKEYQKTAKKEIQKYKEYQNQLQNEYDTWQSSQN